MRAIYFLLGIFSLALGAMGVVLPLLPTVPFMILAAFCFARSSPTLERRIVEHPALKPHIVAWREKRAISKRGKSAALVAFAVSAGVGLLLLAYPISLVPILVGTIGSWWILSHPTA